MPVPRDTVQTMPLPPALLSAAADYIADARPGPAQIDANVAAFALALGYDRQTAHALVTRVHASARMFAHPAWNTLRRYRTSLSIDNAILFNTIVCRFIAREPLDAALAFDLRRLSEHLLSTMPPMGNG